MKHLKLLIVFVLALDTGVFSQTRISFELTAINAEDSLGGIDFTTNLIKPKTLNITAAPLSPITELTDFKGYILAVRFEVLKSKLQDKEHLVIGMVLYKKKKGDQKWVLLSRHDHWPVYDANGNLGMKGIQTASVGFRLSEDGPDYDISYQLTIN